MHFDTIFSSSISSMFILGLRSAYNSVNSVQRLLMIENIISYMAHCNKKKLFNDEI